MQIQESCPEGDSDASVLEPVVVSGGLGSHHEPDNGKGGDHQQFLVAEKLPEAASAAQETNCQKDKYDHTGDHQDPLHGDWSYGFVDTSIVFTQMMLKAHDLGLGTCWVGLFDSAKTQAAFEIPEDVTIVGLLPIGHPAEDAAPANMHFRRKDLTETVTWL